jgi:hypothetical protein
VTENPANAKPRQVGRGQARFLAKLIELAPAIGRERKFKAGAVHDRQVSGRQINGNVPEIDRQAAAAPFME